MTVTDRDLSILDLLVTFGYLVTGMIRSLVFPADKDGSVTRDRLRKLAAAGLIQRRRAEVANPFNGNTVPVWLITEAGIAQLALRTNRPELLNLHPPCSRSWASFQHYVAVADVMLKLQRAVAAQSRVALKSLFFEHTVVNPTAEQPAERYKLYTLTSAPTDPRRIVAAPDAAFELQVGSQHRMAYYLELERGTDSPARIAAKKTPGFQGLFESKKWRRHFPEAPDFRVLCIAPTVSWVEMLRKAVRTKMGHERWFFVAATELTAESFLYGNIVYPCTDAPRPLVHPEAAPLEG